VHDLLEHPEVPEQALAKVADLRKKESDARLFNFPRAYAAGPVARRPESSLG